MTEPEGLRPFEYYQAPPPGWAQQGPPKPGTIPLRPLGLGDILGGSIATIRRNWQIMLSVPFVVALVLQAVQIPLTLNLTRNIPNLTRVSRPEDVLSWVGAVYGTTGIIGVVAGLLSTLSLGVLTVVISRAVLGQRATFGEAVRAAASRYLPLLGLVIMIGLIVVAALVVPLGIGIGLGVLIGGTGAIVGLALLGGFVGFGLVIYLVVCFTFAPTALILEPQPVFRALSRSRWLARGAWWRILGYMIVAGLIAGAVTIVLQIPISVWEGITTFQSMKFGPRGTPVVNPMVLPSLPQLLVGGLLTAIASAVTTPFANGVTVLLYHDQRIRLERFDIPLAQMAAGPQPS